MVVGSMIHCVAERELALGKAKSRDQVLWPKSWAGSFTLGCWLGWECLASEQIPWWVGGAIVVGGQRIQSRKRRRNIRESKILSLSSLNKLTFFCLTFIPNYVKCCQGGYKEGSDLLGPVQYIPRNDFQSQISQHIQSHIQ